MRDETGHFTEANSPSTGDALTPSMSPSSSGVPADDQKSDTLFPAATANKRLSDPVAVDRAEPNHQDPVEPESKPTDRTAPDAAEPLPSENPAVTERDQEPRPGTTGQGSRKRSNPAPEGAITVTILEAARILREEKGFDEIKPRAIQRYCSGERRAGQLKCYWNYQSDQYLVDRASLDEFAERLSNEAPRGISPEEPTKSPVAASASKPAELLGGSVQDTQNVDLTVYDHPYVKKLEDRIDKHEERYAKLQADYREDMNSAQQRLIQLQQATVIGNSETLADFMLKSGQGLSDEIASERSSSSGDDDLLADQDQPLAGAS